MRLTNEEIEIALKRMRRFIWSLIKRIPNGMDPEDIFQDIVLDVLCACYEKYDPSLSSLTTFIGNVARWRMREFRRSWVKLRNGLELKEELIVCESHDATNAREIIWTLSSDLPVKQRVVVRNLADGMTEEEIGKRLGITRQAVSLLLLRAIKKMRDKGDPRDDRPLT